MRTVRLRVELREVSPLVLRVLDVPAAITLPELHRLLQVGVGWADAHLHVFIADGITYAVPREEDLGDGDEGFEVERDQSGVCLSELGDRFIYVYDLGDGWEHDVEVLGPGQQRPGCIYGEGDCPPEDCGGPAGYARLRTVLTDPVYPGRGVVHRQVLPDVREFDQTVTDLLIRQSVGEVPGSVGLVLGLAKGGVQLTPGGRLPRDFVRQVQAHRLDWCWRGARPALVEGDLMPLAALHDLLHQTGLVRVSNGVVKPTRGAADDLQVIRRLRSWFTGDDFGLRVSELAIARVTAIGALTFTELVVDVFGFLGRGWVTPDGQPATRDDVANALRCFGPTLQGLDLAVTRDDIWAAGPSARCLLPGATALAYRWTSTTHPIPRTASGRRHA